jgi:hypothetical protein
MSMHHKPLFVEEMSHPNNLYLGLLLGILTRSKRIKEHTTEK